MVLHFKLSFEFVFYTFSVCGHYYVQYRFCKSAFSTYSIGKLVFRLSVFSVFSVCPVFRFHLHRLMETCFFGQSIHFNVSLQKKSMQMQELPQMLQYLEATYSIDFKSGNFNYDILKCRKINFWIFHRPCPDGK